jgi:hypothetical protein
LSWFDTRALLMRTFCADDFGCFRGSSAAGVGCITRWKSGVLRGSLTPGWACFSATCAIAHSEGWVVGDSVVDNTIYESSCGVFLPWHHRASVRLGLGPCEQHLGGVLSIWTGLSSVSSLFKCFAHVAQLVMARVSVQRSETAASTAVVMESAVVPAVKDCRFRSCRFWRPEGDSSQLFAFAIARTSRGGGLIATYERKGSTWELRAHSAQSHPALCLAAQ